MQLAFKTFCPGFATWKLERTDAFYDIKALVVRLFIYIQRFVDWSRFVLKPFGPHTSLTTGTETSTYGEHNRQEHSQ